MVLDIPDIAAEVTARTKNLVVDVAINSMLSPSTAAPVANGERNALRGGAWKRLEHTTFEDRTTYGGGHPSSIGEPRVWAEYQTTTLAIMPPPERLRTLTR